MQIFKMFSYFAPNKYLSEEEKKVITLRTHSKVESKMQIATAWVKLIFMLRRQAKRGYMERIFQMAI